MRLCIICSSLPPSLDGIGDYTARLAGSVLASDASHEVTIIASTDGRPAPISGVRVIADPDVTRPNRVRRVAHLVANAKPDCVLLQYNPFMYGRWGMSPFLAGMLRSIRVGGRRPRIAVMVHERYFSPVTGVRSAAIHLCQRHQLWRVGNAADVVLFSTEQWAPVHRKSFPRATLHHLPVGSNIPVAPVSRPEARARIGVDADTFVLGMFGTAHFSRPLTFVRAAARSITASGRRVVVLYVGPHGKEVREALPDICVISDGPLEAPEVSSRLSAVDIYLAPYVDGVSTRRTTFISGLQHGLPTVGTSGINTSATLLGVSGSAFLLSPSHDETAFCRNVRRLADDPAGRSALGVSGRKLFEAKFSWPVIARSLLSYLSARASTS